LQKLRTCRLRSADFDESGVIAVRNEDCRVSIMPHPPARNHTELVVWQLCSQLRALVLRYTRAAHVREDRRYYSDIRAAARSACYLTSEGYYRKRDGDFHNFLVWARGSLGEVSDQVCDGREQGYFSAEQAQEMISLVKRSMAANRRLREYLKSTMQNAATERLPRKRLTRRGPAERVYRKANRRGLQRS
jgi:four helix bundle protein